MCSVALAEKGQLVALKEHGGEYTHAENLTLFIQEVMQQAGRDLSELDAVAISRGPGSYTGLRIGSSAAKGLCYALEKPFLAISTLQALSQPVVNKWKSNPDEQMLLCPMLDARRMEVYCALYSSAGLPVSDVSAKVMDELSFREEFEKGKIVFFGPGAEKCMPLLQHPNAVFEARILPSAKWMIPLAEESFARKQFEDCAYFEPDYLKEFVAGKKKERP
jgi:tRNA threonylcarbamoyladenosine biosynthesis protein TsaB